MKQLLNVMQINNSYVYSFTKEAVDILREKFKGAKPEAEVMYSYSSDQPNHYVTYLHNGVFKESARLTNAVLAKCVQTCIQIEEEMLKSASISETTENKKQADINQQVKPTVEQIYQDIAFNMSESDQHQLALLIASNVGYGLIANTIEDIDVIGVRKTEMNDPSIPIKATDKTVKEINTGGSCDYYRVGVTHPMTKAQVPYIAECGDIMESLEMTYAEANMFKEIWRTAAERTLGLKKAGNNAKRAAEKIVFFAERNYQQSVHGANLTDSRKVNK